MLKPYGKFSVADFGASKCGERNRPPKLATAAPLPGGFELRLPPRRCGSSIPASHWHLQSKSFAVEQS
jgi:hypothetical protein